MSNTSLMSPPEWYVPRISAISPTGREVNLVVGEVVDLSVEVEPWQTVPSEQEWQRRAVPVLSTTLTTQDWSRVMLYMPGVIRADGIYKMWYVGTSGPPRPANCHLGYATSQDGIHWEEYPDNPIITDEALQDAGGWGRCFQSPFVLYDLEERRYRMWFSALTHYEETADGELVEMTQQVGYAESPDGIAWEIHPEPVTRSGRCPSVMQEADGTFTMWVNARPEGDPDPSSIYGHTMLLRSPDGIHWEEIADVLQPEGIYKSCVYPFVMRDGPGLVMWHGGHREALRDDVSFTRAQLDDAYGDWFDLTFARSADGRYWTERTGHPVFPPSADRDAFDARYTSTPYVLKLPGRYVLYYSARDMLEGWLQADGTLGPGRGFAYRHIGYATLDAIAHTDPTLRYTWSVDGEPRAEPTGTMQFCAQTGGTHHVTCQVENANGNATYTWKLVAGA